MIAQVANNRTFFRRLALVLLAGLAVRIAYVLAQPSTDPEFARPLLDGRYYLDWARDLAAAKTAVPEAYYLAPLYPILLAGWFMTFGESLSWLYLGQQLLGLATATLIGLYTRRRIGDAAAIGAVALFVFHQPLLFFASRPLSETVGIFLLVTSLWLYGRSESSARTSIGVGILAGLACLVRPAFMLIPVVWALGELRCRRGRRAAWIMLGVSLAILPVTLRNLVHSGHVVLVSSNAGITAYHGNGPGVSGIFKLPRGFSGEVSEQRLEATRLARAASGRELDAVEADGWWGRRAVETRVEDPLGSLVLLGRRTMLLVDNYEHALDYHPMLDDNPFRLTLRWGGSRFPPSQVFLVPFALLLGLAVFAAVQEGWRGSGGWPTWSAVACCAATPVVFYVSSRYRIPLAALLTIPAGAGLASLLSSGSRRRPVALAAGAVCMAVSLLVPSGALRRLETSTVLSNRAATFVSAGRLDLAESHARMATELDPKSATPLFNLGVTLAKGGRWPEAETAFRQALERDSGMAGAATNLASILMDRGSGAEAIPILREALVANPFDTGCWTNLVLALARGGDLEGARRAAGEARANDVVLGGDLLRAIGVAPGAG